MFVSAARVQKGIGARAVPGQGKYWFYYTVNVISVHKYIVILSYLAKSC